MRVSTFIDHCKHVVPFGELVVKYAVQFHYVAAKATYIRLLHGKIGILEEFFRL